MLLWPSADSALPLHTAELAYTLWLLTFAMMTSFLLCRGYFTERDAAIVTRTLLQLVEYCHARGILHRGAVQCHAAPATWNPRQDAALLPIYKGRAEGKTLMTYLLQI